MDSKQQTVTTSGEMLVIFLSIEYLRIEFAHLRTNSQGRGWFLHYLKAVLGIEHPTKAAGVVPAFRS